VGVVRGICGTLLSAGLAVSCGEYVAVKADPPAIRNMTERDITISVQQYRGGLACGATAENSLWKAPETRFLHHEDYAPLPVPIGNSEDTTPVEAADAGSGDAGSAASVNDPRCGAAIISTAGLDPVGVRWDVRGIHARDWGDDDEQVVPGAIYLEQFGDTVRVTWGRGMRRFDAESP
jgi:hypothetical protein